MEKRKNKFIFIAGGSFQGKSLIAMHLANKYKYSGVISTDMVRNLLRNMATPEDKEKYYSTSTYRMRKANLNRQKQDVSKKIEDLLPIYEERGEKMIFEGMHFSDKFIKKLSKSDYLKIFINNDLGLKDKVRLKGVTRNSLSVEKEMERFSYGSTTYSKFENRIIEIHKDMKKVCEQNGFNIVSFTEIGDGKKQCCELVDDYLRKK